MKPFFKELFKYNNDCNQKLSSVFIDNPNKTSEKALRLFSHVLNAHQIWNNRIKTTQSAYGVWVIHVVQDLKKIDRANYEQTLQLLNTYNLNTTINYINSKGQTFTNSIQDIVFHIINHSTYHRGQIATALKDVGLEPLSTDFIYFKR